MNQQYVAFLRAINVGGRNVKKDQLKQIFADLGFSNIDTYLASGNVIFESKITDREELETIIEEKMEQSLNFEVPAFVRTRAELANLIEDLPFESNKRGKDHTYVSFVKSELTESAKEKIEKLNSDLDTLQPGELGIHWWYRRSQGDSELTNSEIEKAANQLSTRRNTNTLKRIQNKYFGSK